MSDQTKLDDIMNFCQTTAVHKHGEARRAMACSLKNGENFTVYAKDLESLSRKMWDILRVTFPTTFPPEEVLGSPIDLNERT